MSIIGAIFFRNKKRPSVVAGLGLVLALGLTSSCSKPSPTKVSAGGPSYLAEIVPIGIQPREGVLRSFKIQLYAGGDSAKVEEVLVCSEGELTDRYGNIVQSLKGSPPFYGYLVNLILDKHTGMPQELHLDPLFDNGSNVGDSLVFEWNEETRTFVKAFSNIP